MLNKEITKRANKLKRQIKKAYRIYEKVTIKLGSLQRSCKHMREDGFDYTNGVQCSICGLEFDHDTGEPLYPDSFYQSRMANKEVNELLRKKLSL